jgi:beta-lactamase superfamily II metal-dependent hydrolase
VLYPGPTNHFPQADDNALVLKGEFHGTRVLLLSDLGRPGQNALLERTNDLRADIVVTGLPEQTESLSDALLAAVQPKVIIVMDSEFPATKRASAALHERLEKRNIPVVYTRTAGAVKISLRPNRWSVKPMNGEELSGRPNVDK